MNPSACRSTGDTAAASRGEGQEQHTAIFIMSVEHHASCTIMKKPSGCADTFNHDACLSLMYLAHCIVTGLIPLWAISGIGCRLRYQHDFFLDSALWKVMLDLGG